MSTRTKLRRTSLSPAMAAILGFLLLAANIAVDVATALPAAQVETPVQAVGSKG